MPIDEWAAMHIAPHKPTISQILRLQSDDMMVKIAL